jgi:hypothetical protein
VLFTADFGSDGVVGSAWKVASGKWSVTDGELAATGTSAGWQAIALQQDLPTDIAGIATDNRRVRAVLSYRDASLIAPGPAPPKPLCSRPYDTLVASAAPAGRGWLLSVARG